MLNNAVYSFQTELLELRQKVNGAKADLNNAREKYKETSEALAALSEELVEVKTENLKMKSNEAAFKITILGIPNQCETNIMLKKIAALLDVSFSEHEVADAYRINTKDQEKPRPLVIRFTSTRTRNLFIKNRKKVFYFVQ
jgi:hypothetical protein